MVGAFAGGQAAADQQPVPGLAVAIHVCAYFPYPAKIWVNGTSTALDGVVKKNLVRSRPGSMR